MDEDEANLRGMIYSPEKGDGSPTRFTHQIRDQALHLAFGAIAGLLCGSYPTAMACAALYGAVREAEQWKTLNTPSVWDSALDWSFCVLGAMAGQIVRTHI